MSDIEKFDMTTHIRNKVRKVIIGSVPDEALDTMIQAEYDSFFEAKKSAYGGQTFPSPFAQLVREELEGIMRVGIKLWIEKNLPDHWEEEQMVSDLVVKFAPIVQAQLVARLTSSALGEIKNQLLLDNY